jgi:hypothetical protein
LTKSAFSWKFASCAELWSNTYGRLEEPLSSPPDPGLRVIDIINVWENSGTSTHSIAGSRVGCTWQRR